MSSISAGGAATAFYYMAGQGGISLTSLIFVILVLKNLASGWGGDFEKGTMQTFLTYPLKRWKFLLARFISSFLLVLGLLALAEFSVVFLIAPGFASANFGSLALGFLTSLTLPLMVSAVVVLTVQWTKSGGVPFAVGLVAYFVILIFSAFLYSAANSGGYGNLAWFVYFLNPFYALTIHFNGGPYYYPQYYGIPAPSFGQAEGLLAANLLLSTALIVVGWLLFARRTEA